MRGWQQGRNGVTIVYEEAMVFESLTYNLKTLPISAIRKIVVIEGGLRNCASTVTSIGSYALYCTVQRATVIMGRLWPLTIYFLQL